MCRSVGHVQLHVKDHHKKVLLKGKVYLMTQVNPIVRNQYPMMDDKPSVG